MLCHVIVILRTLQSVYGRFVYCLGVVLIVIGSWLLEQRVLTFLNMYNYSPFTVNWCVLGTTIVILQSICVF